MGWTPDKFKKPTPAELKRQLSPEQFHVTQEGGTECAFSNGFAEHHGDGLYVDIVSGEPLFASTDKFDSGTGWPSFIRPLVPENIITHEDGKFGLSRTEVRSKHADSHLGHVFPDGPKPTGMRYCINSAALRFIAVADLEKEGYAEFLKLFREC